MHAHLSVHMRRRSNRMASVSVRLEGEEAVNIGSVNACSVLVERRSVESLERRDATRRDKPQRRDIF